MPTRRRRLPRSGPTIRCCTIRSAGTSTWARASASENRMKSTDLETLAAQVRYLTDRQEILDCLNRYCRGLDRLDPELIASAYHPDAVDNHYTFVGGVAAF